MTIKHFKAISYILATFLSINSFAQTSIKSAPQKIKVSKPKTLKVAVNTNTAALNATTTAIGGISQVQVSTEEKEVKSFTFVTGLEYSAKVSSEEKVGRESGYDLVLWPMYKINDDFNLAAKAVVSHANNGPQDTTVSDTSIDLGIKGLKINEQLKSVHSIRVVAPTSQASREDNRLQTSLSTSNGLSYDNPYFNLVYALRLTKNIHEFTQNKDFKPNIEYSVAHGLSLNIPVVGSFYVTLDGSFRNAWTYSGYQRSAFSVNGDLNYKIEKNFEINVGVSTDGSALRSNGVDSNIALFDQNTSVVRAGMSYAY